MNRGGRASFGGLAASFLAQSRAVKDIWRRAAAIVNTPEIAGYGISVGPIPRELLAPRRNFFSVIFLSVYRPMGIAPERISLYARINQLFRSWVTSADNLLDGEDKAVIPLRLPGNSRVMREVVSLMLADRVLCDVLNDAVDAGILARPAARTISAETLRVLLPSAAEEAGEEGGIDGRPEPETVIEKIHPLKTGMLFKIPFMAPRILGDGDQQIGDDCARALFSFGIACQLLDDLRDMARDHIEARQNYALSWVRHRSSATERSRFDAIMASERDPAARIHPYFPTISRMIADRSDAMMRDAFATMADRGLSIPTPLRRRLIRGVFLQIGIEPVAAFTQPGIARSTATR